MSIFKRDRTFQQPLNWTTTFFMLMFHVGAVAALFMFSWKNLAIAVFLWWLTGSMGIGMAYHRLLTHRGYKTPRWLEYWMAICGTMALEGGPIAWVATHRIHHQNTDKEGDPHSPNDGGLWAHMGWIITGQAMHQNTAELLPYVPDLRKQKFYMWISKYHWTPLIGLGAILFVVGGWSCQFGHAYVGFAAVSHLGHIYQQFLGCDFDLWRRLAQQSPCSAASRQAWAYLV